MTERIKNNNVWTVSEVSDKTASELSQSAGVSFFLSKLLISRGFDTPQKVYEHLNCGVHELGNPFDMCDMDKAVNRINRAVEKREKILVFGDYDVDGVTSVALLLRYLASRGVKADYYIPKRVSEGYGLNKSAIEEFANNGVNLIITVDSGITAHDEVEFARIKGIDVVITDHHECRSELPKAAAVVNPHRKDCNYPFKELAGVGVVFKLVCALENNKNIALLCSRYSDIVALGTVADVMPIIGENRAIVKLGLKHLENTKNAGLAALAKESFSERTKAARKNLTASSIGFVLAPRINAAGRIGDVNRAVELLVTERKPEAENIASYLCAVNRQRQVIENDIFKQAVEKIENEFDFENDRIIVLESDSWHLGVIGIVASKITERYKLPSILVTFDKDVGKGSCRSVSGFNINEALSNCSDCLVKYGGHELAAGLTVARDKIEEFRKRINKYAKETFDFDSVVNYIDADFEIDFSDITVNSALEISKLEPFGLMNPVPIFCLRNVKIAEIYSIGDGKHLRLTLENNGSVVTALYFGMTKENFAFTEGDIADFMGNIDLNDFRGTLSVQFLIKDVRMTESMLAEKERQRQLFSEITENSGTCPERYIPKLNHFKAAFLYLKRIVGFSPEFKQIDIWRTARCIAHDYIPDFSALTLNIVLTVFDEMGLAFVRRTDCDFAEIKLNKTEGKVNLDDSEFLKKIKNN